MKKQIYQSLALLLVATACSSDDAPTMPDTIVNSVPAKAQNITVEAPAIKNAPAYGDFNGKLEFENGQTLTFTIIVNGQQNLAFVKEVGGTATTVSIPSGFTLKKGDKDVEFLVAGWNLNNYEGISETVTTLRIPASAVRWYDSKTLTRLMTPGDFNNIIAQTSTLANIELAENQRGYCSINGAVYTYDAASGAITTFVCCPRGKTGEFVVANGVETISTGSFSNCRKLTRIVLPESTKLIEDNAMEFDNDLLAIDILAGHAPKAGQYAFGSFARNAQLRIMPGSKATYLPGLYDGVEPIMPEELVELTSATAALANNTEATVQMYKKCTEIYLAAVENYNNYLIAYKEATEYYTLEEATMPEYDKKLAACTAVKNQYYAKLKEYQIEFANYRTEAETVEAASSIDAGAELADAYKQCTQAEKDLNQLVKECTNYYKDANAKYKTTYEVYKAELSESQEYDGYKFFKPENIKETNFEIK